MRVSEEWDPLAVSSTPPRFKNPAQGNALGGFRQTRVSWIRIELNADYLAGSRLRFPNAKPRAA
jgi:hypothetical protein